MCVCVWEGGVNVTILPEFAAREGGEQSPSRITSVSHFGYFILHLFVMHLFIIIIVNVNLHFVLMSVGFNMNCVCVFTCAC